MRNPFRYFNISPKVIRLAVMMYFRFPMSLRQVEDMLHERGIDVCHETVRVWWNRFGPMFAVDIRNKRSAALRALPQWRWHLDEVFVKINGEMHYPWRAVDHERRGARGFCHEAPRSHDCSQITEADHEALWPTEGHRHRPSSLIRRGDEGDRNAPARECGHWLNNRAEISHQPFRRVVSQGWWKIGELA